MQKRIVLGSLLGTLAVNAAFIACGGMSPGTGGPIGSIMSVLSDGGVAHAADDGGVPTCSCPVPPAPPVPPETTFSLRVDRGNGPEEPMAEYSTASVGVTPALLEDGSRGAYLSAGVVFKLPNRDGFSFSCNVTVKEDKTVVPGTALCNFTNSTEVSGVVVSTLTDTSVEFMVPSFSIRRGSSPNFQTVTFTNIIFRATDPNAHYLTPPRAYRP